MKFNSNMIKIKISHFYSISISSTKGGKYRFAKKLIEDSENKREGDVLLQVQ
jgi:hypothetical protein